MWRGTGVSVYADFTILVCGLCFLQSDPSCGAYLACIRSEMRKAGMMLRRLGLGLPLVAAALLVAACGGGSPAAAPAPSPAPSASAAAAAGGGVTLKTDNG